MKLERALQDRKLANIILYFGKSHMCPLVQTKDVLDTSLSHSLMPSIYSVRCLIVLLNFCFLVLFVQNKINNIRSPNSTTIIYITELEMCVYSDTDRLIYNHQIALYEVVTFMSLYINAFINIFVIFQLKRIIFFS